MATKRFCDFCGNEMSSPNNGRHQANTMLRGETGHQERVNISLTVEPAGENTPPFDVCTRCMFRAVHQAIPLREGGDHAE